MPKYLIIASYTAEGASGLLKDGGSKRVEVVSKLAESVGANVESFYFAFGSDDVFVTIDAPDHAAASALSLAVSASGAVRTRTVVLIEPAEIDAAAEKAKGAQYRPPGG